MSILIFLGVLFVLVLVHELGHFIVAKWTGMRVDEFGIGFPPRLFGIQKGETLYSINALPIGGFVKIYGEDSIVEGDNAVPAQGSFTSKNKWAQSAVLLAGVTMNILFAWLLVTIAFSIGVQSSVEESVAGPGASLTITSVLPGSPAADAKLTPGVVIKGMSAGGEELTALTPSAFSAFVATRSGEPITVAYIEGGELRVTQVSPRDNIIEGNPEKAAIGVALTQFDTVKRPLSEAMIASFEYTVTGLKEITVGIVSLLYDAVRFKADFSQVAGPVGIVGLVGEASAYGVTALLMFTAFISLNLAVINVFPFPALDGGRFLFVIIEALKGSPITPRFVATVNAVGFFILIALMVVVTWNDIARLI
jgi:regulator of sigma E protease